MKITYVLHKNPIAPDPDACRAIVVQTQMLGIPDVVKQITGEGSILKETECTAVTEAFLKKIGSNLADGIGFHCDYFSVSIEIQGVFKDDKDKFDANRHHIYPNVTPGKPWKENLNNAKLEKVAAEENKPKPATLFDFKSKTLNQTITPGGMAELQGEQLKIDDTAADEGIFFISGNGGGEIKVAYVYQNFPKTLQFEVPEGLAAGTYTIEVRSRQQNCKSIRSGKLAQTVNVV